MARFFETVDSRTYGSNLPLEMREALWALRSLRTTSTKASRDVCSTAIE
jgi:hypothetical protein